MAFIKEFKADLDPTTKRSGYQIFRGTADPEGSQAANPGDLYIRNSSPAEFYLKSTGTGNTGWTQLNAAPTTSNQTIANNQSSAANVTGLLFDDTTDYAFHVKYAIVRTTSTDTKKASGFLSGQYDSVNNEWTIGAFEINGDSGVIFSITSGGQVQYTSDNMSGASYAGNMSFLQADIIEV